MFLGHLFYFIGLIVFLVNIQFLYELFDYIRIKEWFVSFKKITNKTPTSKDFKKGDLDKFKKLSGVIGLNFFWIFFGILSSNWKIFLAILIISSLMDLLIHTIGQFKSISKLILIFKTLVTTLSILILTINHFHLHLDLFELLCRFFL
jgi:hypothetical protein